MSEKRYPRRFKYLNKGEIVRVDKPGALAVFEDYGLACTAMDEAVCETCCEPCYGGASLVEVFDHHDEPATIPTAELTAPDRAAIERLRVAAVACDIVMETAAMHNVFSILPPTYRDSWAQAHVELRAALAALTQAEAAT